MQKNCSDGDHADGENREDSNYRDDFLQNEPLLRTPPNMFPGSEFAACGMPIRASVTPDGEFQRGEEEYMY